MKNSMAKEISQLFDERSEMTRWPSRTVARWIVENRPQIGSDIELVRGAVRYVRGTHGKENRVFAKNSGHEKHFEHEINYDMPLSKAAEYKPYVIDTAKSDRLLGLFDVHVPFHDMNALALAIKHGKKRGVNGIFLGGDFMDQYWLSRFVKRGAKHPFSWMDEVELTNDALDWIMDEFPDAAYYYKIGNHEDRFQDYINRRIPEMANDPELRFENKLQLKQRGFEVIESGQYAMFDRLKIVHFHEFGSFGVGNAVNQARTLYNKAGQSAMCGHAHKTSEHSETRMDGSLVTCWSVGCLCDTHPEYAPLGKANNGFAVVTMENYGFNVENKRIYKGRVYGE